MMTEYYTITPEDLSPPSHTGTRYAKLGTYHRGRHIEVRDETTGRLLYVAQALWLRNHIDQDDQLIDVFDAWLVVHDALGFGIRLVRPGAPIVAALIGKR